MKKGVSKILDTPKIIYSLMFMVVVAMRVSAVVVVLLIVLKLLSGHVLYNLNLKVCEG